VLLITMPEGPATLIAAGGIYTPESGMVPIRDHVRVSNGHDYETDLGPGRYAYFFNAGGGVGRFKVAVTLQNRPIASADFDTAAGTHALVVRFEVT